MGSDELADEVEREVIALHEFFVAWFTGRCSDDDQTFEEGIAGRLTPAFHYVMPGGEAFRRERLLTGLRAAHGTNPAFRIAIQGVQVRLTDARSVLVTYQEFQTGAIHSKAANARTTTAVFVRDGARLRWHHIQETWLPEARGSD